MRNSALPAVVLLGLVLIAYLPAFRAGFIWDDDKYVTNNPMLTAPDGLRQIWFSTHTQSQYFPLVYTTFRLERKLWGLNPLGYHLVNVLLHGLNAALVWLVLRRLKLPGAWFAAAIFALHPVQAESVAWVTELKNVESMFFYLLAVLAWVRFLEGGGQRAEVSGQWSVVSGPYLYYFLALAAYLLALFAKTTACTLPAALVLAVWLTGRRLCLGRIAQILPFVALGAVMGLVSVWWEGNLGTFNDETKLSFSFMQRVLIAARALWFYPGKLVWPADLTFIYPRWEVSGANWTQYIALAGCVGFAVVVWVWRRKLGIGVISGVLFFGAALAPLLGFISLYTFQYSFVADHYQYTASIGLIALFAGVVATWSVRRRWVPLLTGTLQALLLVVLGCLTSQRCGAYLNAETLWRDTVARNPESWMAHHNLAFELQNRGQADEAIEHYRLALLHNPRHAKAQNNLGLLLASKGKPAEAIACYQAALAIDADFVMAHNNLAVALGNQGNYGEAVGHLKKALKLAPNSLGLWMNLGDFLRAQGKTNDAFECYRKATGLFPGETEAWRRLAVLALDQDNAEQAVSAYRHAAQLAPDRVDLLFGLGNALLAQTNCDEAIGVYRKILAAAPDEAVVHYRLGVALGLRGQSDEAKTELQEAVRLKPDYEEARKQLLVWSLRQAK